MKLLQTDTFTLERPLDTSTGGYDDGNGNWIPKSTKTYIIKAKGSIQPLVGSDLRKLPESFRNVKSYLVFTKLCLKGVESDQGQEADVIFFDNEYYQVQRVENWRQLHTKHYKCWVVKVERP